MDVPEKYSKSLPEDDLGADRDEFTQLQRDNEEAQAEYEQAIAVAGTNSRCSPIAHTGCQFRFRT